MAAWAERTALTRALSSLEVVLPAQPGHAHALLQGSAVRPTHSTWYFLLHVLHLTSSSPGSGSPRHIAHQLVLGAAISPLSLLASLGSTSVGEVGGGRVGGEVDTYTLLTPQGWLSTRQVDARFPSVAKETDTDCANNSNNTLRALS